VTATWHRGTLRILGHHLTPQQAYQLAEAIADALADAPTVVLSTTVADQGKGSRNTSGPSTT